MDGGGSRRRRGCKACLFCTRERRLWITREEVLQVRLVDAVHIVVMHPEDRMEGRGHGSHHACDCDVDGIVRVLYRAGRAVEVVPACMLPMQRLMKSRLHETKEVVGEAVTLVKRREVI